jgi:hypothetical protein
MMGASGWNYFVPYQKDINKALQELREAEFEALTEEDMEPHRWKKITFEEVLQEYPNVTEDQRESLFEEYQRIQALPEPDSIETWLASQDEAGTGSILDIKAISATSDFAAAAPLTPQQLETFFGTDTPTHEMVEAKSFELARYLQKDVGRYWCQGTYIVVYKDGQPWELFFTGYSGD